ncbi:hypothetical protein [Bdellovibrio sp. HCB337]|uniref:hypothetical protein n=1 Tax=Bdellovibrio sp. HCB337 TaxID=3394358 RepID=UPI0039A6372D
MKNTFLKVTSVALLSMISLNSFAGGFLEQIENSKRISRDQARSIALIHARAMNASEDVNIAVRLNAEPKYDVSYTSHFKYDEDPSGTYRVIVDRSVSYQTCKMTLTINDRTGQLVEKSVSCE